MYDQNTQELASHFDRDYGIADLLPVPLLERVCRGWEDSGQGNACIFFPDGELHWPEEECARKVREAARRILDEGPPRFPVSVEGEGLMAWLFPLHHQLDLVGLLAVVFEGEAGDRETRLTVGRFVEQMLSDMMNLQYRASVTADLHGRVVERSYAELEEKIRQLEASEEKYRELAANLEILVEQKSEEIRLTHARLMQQEKMASIGHLAAGVAHEINNPMSFISTNLNILGEYAGEMSDLIILYRSLAEGLKGYSGTESDRAGLKERLLEISRTEEDVNVDFIMEDLMGMLKESQDGAERIRKIILALKDFAHPGEPEFVHADINQNMDSTLNIVANELKYSATVTRDYGDLPKIICCPSQLNQVFMNILVNAAQSMESHGTITITTRYENGEAVIRISDTGCGIPRENLSKVFDPFFTTKEVGKGTGLGLNMAYNIVQKHKGVIEVDSEPGRGTTFEIRIPGNLEKPGETENL